MFHSSIVIIIVVVNLHRIVLALSTWISPRSRATRPTRCFHSLDNRLALFRTQNVVENIVCGFDDFILNAGFEDKLLAKSNA
jgi:hypothetical protein